MLPLFARNVNFQSALTYTKKYNSNICHGCGTVCRPHYKSIAVVVSLCPKPIFENLGPEKYRKDSGRLKMTLIKTFASKDSSLRKNDLDKWLQILCSLKTRLIKNSGLKRFFSPAINVFKRGNAFFFSVL